MKRNNITQKQRSNFPSLLFALSSLLFVSCEQVEDFSQETDANTVKVVASISKDERAKSKDASKRVGENLFTHTASESRFDEVKDVLLMLFFIMLLFLFIFNIFFRCFNACCQKSKYFF